MPATIWSVGELVTAAKMNKLGAYLLWDSVDAGVTLPANSITTPSLDQSFGHLLVVGRAQVSDAATWNWIGMRRNGVNANYQGQYSYSIGATTTAAANAAASSWLFAQATGASLASTYYSGFMVLLPNYTQPYQTFVSLYTGQTTGAAAILGTAGGVNNNDANALSTLTFLDSTALNIVAGSRFSVYGIPA